MSSLTRPDAAASSPDRAGAWAVLARRAVSYRQQLLIGSALLARIGLLALIAWWIGATCRQLLFQPSTPNAPWEFELFGWLELAQVADAWVLAACYLGLIGWYCAWWLRRVPHTLALSDRGLRFSGRGQIREFTAEQIRRLRPLSPGLAWIKLAKPRIRPNLLSAPRTLDGWFELSTKNKTWLFTCADSSACAKLRAIGHRIQGENPAPSSAIPVWRTLKILMVIGLLLTLPELTITLAVFYGAWRLLLAILRKRKRAAWERAKRRVDDGPDTQPAVTVARKWAWIHWPEVYVAALLLFPLRAVAFLFRHAIALLRLIPWRRLRVALGDGMMFVLLWFIALLPASLIGLALSSAGSYSQTSPSVARILLARTAPGQRPAIATQALERAVQSGNRDGMRAVLEAGATQGEFQLSGYQAGKRRAQACRDALPLDLTQNKIILDEKPTEAELIFAARCALNPARLQLALSTAAFKHQSGAKLDLFHALDSGNPELILFALDQGAPLDQRDWRGRTPLLAALDLLSTLDPFASTNQAREWERTLRMVLVLLKRGAALEVQDNAQRSAALIAAAAVLSTEPLFERLLATTPPQARSALGATLLHAAAASGDVARAKQFVARGTPTAALTADGRSALHFAKGQAMVWYLIDLGLDPELPDARGQTPFHHAVIRHDLATARVLGGLAANKDAADIFGRSALDYAPVRPKTLESAPQKKSDKTSERLKQVQPKPEWVQWRELADTLHGHPL